jgi:hypothetical protein
MQAGIILTAHVFFFFRQKNSLPNGGPAGTPAQF